MVQSASLKHWRRGRWSDARNLKGVKDRMRSHLDEGVSKTIFRQIKSDPRLKNTSVKSNEAIHVRGDEGQVIDIIE